MENAPVIISIGLLVFLAHLFSALFQKTGIPDVLYLILIGIVVGPLAGIIHPGDFGKVGHIFTTIALVVILFEGGMELKIETLLHSLRSSVALTVTAFVLSMALLTTATHWLFGLGLPASFFVGAVLAGPAPSMVIPLVRQLDLRETTRSTLIIESALGEALAILVALAVLQSYSLEGLEVGRMLGSLLSSFVFAVVIGGAAGFFWSLILDRVRQLRNAMFTTPAFVFMVYGVAEFLHFSGPVAALAFGIAIGNASLFNLPVITRFTRLSAIHHNEAEKQFFAEIVFLLKTFFFVYVGLSVRLSEPYLAILAGTLTIIMFVARIVAVRLSTRPATVPVDDAVRMAALIPKGTAAAVLASIPVQTGIEDGEMMQNLVYGVVILSIIGTSGLIFLLQKTPFAKVLGWLFPGGPVNEGTTGT